VASHGLWYELLTPDADGSQRACSDVAGWTVRAGTTPGRSQAERSEDWWRRRESFSSGLLTTKNFADSGFLTIRSIRTRTGVETRIEHAGR
jgi:hypothetical protein